MVCHYGPSLNQVKQEIMNVGFIDKTKHQFLISEDVSKLNKKVFGCVSFFLLFFLFCFLNILFALCSHSLFFLREYACECQNSLFISF